ncbi:MAG: TetR/AcrR family transcriptional regulator [Cytophagales bacterium]
MNMETKEGIVKGACDLFMRYGIKSITMDDIARHLSMSKKTIYQFFSDKDALVLDVAHMEMNSQKCKWENAAKESKDVIEFFWKATEILKNDMSKMNPSLLFDMKKYHQNGYKAFQQHKSEHITREIKDMLNLGIQQGLFRKDVNVEILSKVRVEQIELMFNPDVFPHDEFTITELSTQIFEHFMYGISTLKGHQRLNELKQITE